MRKAAGFTLIELVIVIVILGILGAVAAPKLFNLQGDAYGANLNAMKSSISTSMVMANAKAQIKGTGFGTDGTTDAAVDGYKDVKFINGYPQADSVTNGKPDLNGILGTLEEFDEARYAITSAAGVLNISPKTIDKTDCRITYTQAKAAEGTGTTATAAKVEAVTTGC